MRNHIALLLAALSLLFIAGGVSASQSITADSVTVDSIELVSLTSDDSQVSGNCQVLGISTDGRYILFESDAAELTPEGTAPAESQLYLRDRASGTTVCATVGSGGKPLSEGFEDAALSANGRYVAFSTSALLVEADTNTYLDVYRWDRVSGSYLLVSTNSGGDASNADAMGGLDISGDGDYVAFASSATNLVTDDGNDQVDVFMHRCAFGTTSLVSEAHNGTQGNSWSAGPVISTNGERIAFISRASNLIANDTNAKDDVFVVDALEGLRCASTAPNGAIGDNWSDSDALSLSDDGRYLVFRSNATNLVAPDTNDSTADVFLYDWEADVNTIVSLDAAGNQLDVATFEPAISGNGLCILFNTEQRLVSADTDDYEERYMRILSSGELIRIGQNVHGEQLSFPVSNAMVDCTGQQVAFTYFHDDLVNGDSNGSEDVFLMTFAGISFSCYLPVIMR